MCSWKLDAFGPGVLDSSIKGVELAGKVVRKLRYGGAQLVKVGVALDKLNQILLLLLRLMVALPALVDGAGL